MVSKETVSVSILGKEFSVSCPEEEREALVKAAKYVDLRMHEMQRSGKVAGIERSAIVAALNVSYELLRLREQSLSAAAEWQRRVKALHARIDDVLREELKGQPS